MAKFKPSKYQQAIYDFIQNGSGHGLVNAVAGSGKSTTIINAFGHIGKDQDCLFLAFNKSIVEELKIKLSSADNVTVSTLHALGCRSIMRKLRVKIDDMKYKRFVYQYFEGGRNLPSFVDPEDESEFKNNILKLVDLGRVNLVKTEDQMLSLASKFELNIIGNECSYALRLIKWGLQKEETIDFTDMIYWPVMKDLWVPKFDWIFIDECQDLNAAQRELFLKSLKTGSRFIAVGDPRQAIYGFSGADIESFNILANLPGVQKFPLSVCYRCDTSIIRLARKLVPQIEERPGADPGEVKDVSYQDAKSGDMVLCRFTAPLVKLCMEYISNGIKAKVQGRDIGVNLVNMIRKTRCKGVNDMMDRLHSEANRIALHFSKSNKVPLKEALSSGVYQNFMDKVKAIEVLSRGLDYSDQVIRRIEALFSDNNNEGIILSTIHKSKGLEADRVFILLPDKIHSPRAMSIDWAREQEFNLEYVAYTRAKHFLGFIKDFDFQ